MALENPLVLPVRKVGVTVAYTGTDGTSQGYYEDFDGFWVYLTLNAFRTIGNANSGASIAQDWAEVLFTHLWNQYTQTRCPVLTSVGGASTRGASAAADYAASKRITLPDERGRVFVGAGTGSSLTARTQHNQSGEEMHTLTTAEMPGHTHGLSQIKFTGGGANTILIQTTGTGSGVTQTTDSAGTGNAHNVMQPSTFEHVLMAAGAR